MMAEFHYQALSTNSRIVKGRIEAASTRDAVSLLTRQQLSVFDIKEFSGLAETRSRFLPRIKAGPGAAWRASFYRNLSVLAEAGVPLDRALKSLECQAQKPRQAKLLGAIARGIAEGRPLSGVLKSTSDHFSDLETGMLAVGEATGSFATVLKDLAENMEQRVETRGRIASALIYPGVLMVLAPLSLIMISSVLVPNIATLFEATGSPMPFMLRAMVAMYRLAAEDTLQVATAGIGIAALTTWLCTTGAFHAWFGRQLKWLPFIGKISGISESAKICGLLAALLKSGAPLQLALKTLEAAVSPRQREALSRVRQAVSTGQKLSTAFAGEKILAMGTSQMIAIGEETNQLESMLLHAAKSQERESMEMIERLMTLLVPLLTVLMGLVVGGIMLSVMQSILSINQLATQ